MISINHKNNQELHVDLPYTAEYVKCKLVFHESVLPVGAAVYANTAIEWLRENK